MNRTTALLLLIVAAESALLFGSKMLALAPAPGILLGTEESRILRGYRKAEQLGCFGCHGPGGFGETPNPLSEDDPTVPSFRGGEPAMYVENDLATRNHPLRPPPAAG